MGIIFLGIIIQSLVEEQCNSLMSCMCLTCLIIFTRIQMNTSWYCGKKLIKVSRDITLYLNIAKVIMPILNLFQNRLLQNALNFDPLWNLDILENLL